MENMEKLYRQVSNLSLLKKSGTIAAIVTFALLGASFGFSRLSLGAYNEKNLTRNFLGEDSMVFKTIVIEVGTDTVARIVAGTTSMTLTGTSSYPWQPRIQYNGATGLWTFKNSGGTATTAFGTVTPAYVAAEIGSTTANYVLQNNGSSTGQLATNPTLAGQGTITATFNANGLVISPAEYSCVDGGTSPFQGQINAKQNSIGQTPLGSSVGSVTTALGSQSINTLNDVNIIFNENDFVKIVGGQLVAGSSTVTVAFSEVTGSATASQLPPISGLLGSATASQLPTVYRLYGTTTNQAAGAFGQLYVQSISGIISGIGTVTGFGTLATASLVSYYRLADLTDSFGANNLTNYGTTTFVAGKYGNCATFNGTTQYLQTSLLSTATTNVSMFGWVYIASASEARPFFTNGVDSDSGTNGYALGVGGAGYYQAGNNLVGLLPSVANLGFATAIGTGWHHVGMTRDSTTWRGYIDGVVCATTFTNDPLTPTGNFTIGRGANSGWKYYNDKIDDVVFYNKCLSAGEIIELYNNTGVGSVPHTHYSTKYADPVNGNTVFEILTPGTATTQASYIYCNATTTVFGLGTNTAVVATTTAYSGWFAGAVRATAFNVASTEKIKENIKQIKIKPDLLDAEVMAKQNYIAGAKVAWMAANQASYTTIVSETGTGSVTVIDTPTMETAYNNYIELAWATDLNQDIYTKNIQKTYEKGFWQIFDSVTPKSWNPKDNPALTRRGFVIEDMPDVVKGDDGQSIDPMALIAYMAVIHKSMKADTIFALNTLKELLITGTVTQQKIDYIQDRLEVLNP